MTTKEKLEKALEALKFIADGKCETVGSDEMYAAVVHTELTTPRTETVEVRRYEQRDAEGKTRFLSLTSINLDAHEKERGDYVIELIGTDPRPIHEPEAWEGEVIADRHERPCILDIPKEWIGKRVIVEVCE